MAAEEKTKNDTAWEDLFDKYNIVTEIAKNGKYEISATQINEVREARLMTKFDHEINLPKIFKDNALAILPISRSKYVISNFHAYESLQLKENQIHYKELPAYLQSLDAYEIPSETIAINCALASGIIADFLGEELLHATVSGRMGSGSFEFGIQNLVIGKDAFVKVENSQIEIDAAFEGLDSLAIIEAKRDIADDFLVRQLYYPFRVWRERIAKPVRPIFLTYSNGVFTLSEYSFSKYDFYNSLVLVSQRNYSLEERTIQLSDLMETRDKARIVAEPNVPFPQADKFERVINICELVSDRAMERDELTDNYAFDVRQTKYYTNAAIYLGMLEIHREERNKSVYRLTDEGKRIIRLPYKKRQLALCNKILSHKVFRWVFDLYLKMGTMPDKETIIGMMKEAELYKIGEESTFKRRASTISSWVYWMLSLAED